ncbi:hypothetical protein AKUH3B111A_14780 [Apilactobacillus kunkeei]|nr:hypothetical protein AKUH3B103M_14850 [Apilactobacillus kunkeei]CAI2672073.1 hypothetical protein AKUH3B111A_14780 [Apilactobacillus kunkeei]CAI2672545.1 hypothetical protein AKUH3B104X_14850 [Apilactobacillus kunkeei]
MIDSNINKYIDNNDVLEIYSKSRDNFEFEDFILGIIVSDKNNYLLVETLDDSGLLDSYTLLLKSDISKISANTNYTKVFTHYVNNNIKDNIYDPFNLKEEMKRLWNMKIDDIIQNFLSHGKVVSLCTNIDEEFHKGNVIAYDNNHIVLDEERYQQTFESGITDKNNLIKLDTITAFDLVSKENKLYEEYLNNH